MAKKSSKPASAPAKTSAEPKKQKSVGFFRGFAKAWPLVLLVTFVVCLATKAVYIDMKSAVSPEHAAAIARENTTLCCSHSEVGGGDALWQRDLMGEVDDLSEQFHAKSQFLYMNDFVSMDVVNAIRSEILPLKDKVHRNSKFALHKAGGAISYYQLRKYAPKTVALYRNPDFRAFVTRLVNAQLEKEGKPSVHLELSPEFDSHAAAIYWYSQKNDRCGWHFDTSFYQGTRYTLLMPLVEESTMRFYAKIPIPGVKEEETGEEFHDEDTSILQRMSWITDAITGSNEKTDHHEDVIPNNIELFNASSQVGAFLLFHGGNIQHYISPMLHDNEERIILTMEFVTDARMTWFDWFIYENANAGGYFGFPWHLKLLYTVILLSAFCVLLRVFFAMKDCCCGGKQQKAHTA